MVSVQDLASMLSGPAGSATSLLSPSTSVPITGNLSPNNNQFNPNLLSGNAAGSFSPKTLSDNTVTTASNNNVNVGQAGVLNLKGTLDLSSPKNALIYAPVSNINSPNASASSAPQQSQSGDPAAAVSGLLSQPGTLIAGVLVLGALFFLSKSAGHHETRNYSEIGRGSKNTGEGANL